MAVGGEDAGVLVVGEWEGAKRGKGYPLGIKNKKRFKNEFMVEHATQFIQIRAYMESKSRESRIT